MMEAFSGEVWAEAKTGEAALALIAERRDDAVKQLGRHDAVAAA